MQKIEKTELELISACATIGSIANSNNSYTLFLAGQITQTIKSLTVSQLLAIHEQSVKSYNEVMS